MSRGYTWLDILDAVDLAMRADESFGDRARTESLTIRQTPSENSPTAIANAASVA